MHDFQRRHATATGSSGVSKLSWSIIVFNCASFTPLIIYLLRFTPINSE